MKSFGLIVTLSLLSSCAGSMARYANEKEGFWSARGKIVRIENLSAKSWEVLPGGLRTEVVGDDCRVTISYAGKTQVFQPGPGSFILFGSEHDYILQPFANVEGGRPESTTWDASGPKGEADAKERALLGIESPAASPKEGS
ncbi:MAG: hypothetical protein AAF517_22035 [Planctomycetota bacterium]